MVANDELLEFAQVFDNLYGTPRAPVEQALAAGRDVLFDIDWQGTQQLREKARSDMASIFVLPPTIAELERRLHTRALDDERVIKSRMAKAGIELSHWAEYDYVIVNDDVVRGASPRCAPSCRRSASSASARPACRSSCATCRPSCSARCSADRSRHACVTERCAPLPLVGRGWGWGLINRRRQHPTPPATLRAAGDPPHKGEGKGGDARAQFPAAVTQ